MIIISQLALKRFALKGRVVRHVGKTLGTLALLIPVTALGSQQNTPIMAVGEIQSAHRNWDTVSIRTALENALSKTRKFTIMERSRLDSLLAERGLSISGITDGNATLGGFTGVDYLLYGRITEARLNKSDLILLGQCKATISLDIRVVAVSTGEIRFSENVRLESVVATSISDADPCRGLSVSDLTSLGAEASEIAVERVAMALFPVKIVRVTDSQVYLNYGELYLQQGDILKIVVLGEGFKDPDTGEILGAEEQEAGFLAVRQTRPKYSIADIVHQTLKLDVGDVARKLSSDEAKGVQRMLTDLNKSRAKQDRICASAEKSMEKHCGRNKNSSRCTKATAKMADACG